MVLAKFPSTLERLLFARPVLVELPGRPWSSRSVDAPECTSLSKHQKLSKRVVFILIETVLHDAHGSQFTFNCLSHQQIRSYAIWSSPSFCDCIFETSFNTVSSSSLGNKELRLENKVTRSSLELRLRENQTISR